MPFFQSFPFGSVFFYTAETVSIFFYQPLRPGGLFSFVSFHPLHFALIVF
jgi:hypothetical protein